MVLVEDKRRDGAALDYLRQGSFAFDQIAFYFYVAVASLFYHQRQPICELFEEAIDICGTVFVLAQLF